MDRVFRSSVLVIGHRTLSPGTFNVVMRYGIDLRQPSLRHYWANVGITWCELADAAAQVQYDMPIWYEGESI